MCDNCEDETPGVVLCSPGPPPGRPHRERSEAGPVHHPRPWSQRRGLRCRGPQAEDQELQL